MRRFYKPSGKISFLILVTLPITLLLFTPIIGFLHSLVLYFSPIFVLDLITTGICIFSAALLCGHWCVTKAKVRNKAAATFAAFLITAAFMVYSILFYCLFAEGVWTVEAVFHLLKNRHLYSILDQVLEEGITVSRGRTSLFTLRDGLLMTVLALEALITFVLVTVNFRLLAGKPFDETRKQWVKEIELKFAYIGNSSEFIDRMCFDDIAYISGLQVLRDININYAAIELYPMDDRYYLSVENYREKGKDKNGSVKFEREKLLEYLMISKRAGNTLLSKQIHHDREMVKAKILDKHSKRRSALQLLRGVAVAALFFLSVFKAYYHGQIDAGILSNPSVIVVAAICCVYYILSMVSGFTKEDVIVLDQDGLDEDWQPPDATTSIYHVDQRDSGLAYKLFYTFMSIISVGFMALIVINFLR